MSTNPSKWHTQHKTVYFMCSCKSDKEKTHIIFGLFLRALGWQDAGIVNAYPTRRWGLLLLSCWLCFRIEGLLTVLNSTSCWRVQGRKEGLRAQWDLSDDAASYACWKSAALREHGPTFTTGLLSAPSAAAGGNNICRCWSREVLGFGVPQRCWGLWAYFYTAIDLEGGFTAPQQQSSCRDETSR
jgi:hypothetical protein